MIGVALLEPGKHGQKMDRPKRGRKKRGRTDLFQRGPIHWRISDLLPRRRIEDSENKSRCRELDQLVNDTDSCLDVMIRPRRQRPAEQALQHHCRTCHDF